MYLLIFLGGITFICDMIMMRLGEEIYQDRHLMSKRLSLFGITKLIGDYRKDKSRDFTRLLIVRFLKLFASVLMKVIFVAAILGLYDLFDF